MNQKAKAFKAYLDENKIKDVFAIEEMPKDEWKAVFFRSQIDINGNKLPVAVVFDTSIYGLIRVLIAPQSLREDNEAALLKMINGFNKKFKAFKYYLDDSGSLILDICLISDAGIGVGDMVYAMFDIVIHHLNESYKDIMKSVWS